MDDLLQEFIAETRDMLGALSTELVLWEHEPSNSERLDAVFRFVHTVKGSCGFLNLPRFERLSHAAEDILSDLRSGAREPSPELVDAVLAIVDRIGALIEAIDGGDSLPDEGDAELIAALRRVASPPSAHEVEPDKSVASAPATPPRAGATPGDGNAAVRSIRVPLDLIDRLMHGVSDMVLARNEVGRCLREQMNDPATESAFERLSACIAEMRDAIGQTRMQRIERLFSPLPRLVRDLCGELGKQVALTTDGASVELDREMIEMIRDPLTHIVRNAIDHGIEAPEDRMALGKPRAGQLSVSARQSGNQILIEVADDGRGISLDRLVEKAIAARLKTPQEAASLSDRAKLDLIFAPGLSTADQVTAISGRGVGMDVVRANVERIGGSIDLENAPGKGLRVTVRVPLTLTIIPCLTVRAGDQEFALPRSAIREILFAGNDQLSLRRIGGTQLAYIRGECLPLVELEDILGLESEEGTASQHRTIVSIGAASDYRYALSVDSVIDHEELVVRPGAPVVMASGLFAGTTLPDNGRPMLLLDPLGIALRARIEQGAAMPVPVEAHAVDANTAEGASALLFRERDGAVRAIRLVLVDRVEDIARERIALVAGRVRALVDGESRPVFGLDVLPADDRIKMLALSDGVARLHYAIDDIIDIVRLPAQFTPASTPALVAGVVLIGEDQVELIDGHWLFAHHGDPAISPAAAAAQPTCWIGVDSGWGRSVLAPLVEAAGYRPLFAGSPGEAPPEDADCYILGESGTTAADPDKAGKPLIRLSAEPVPADETNEAIYRYDHAALVSALRMSRASAGERTRS